MHFLELKTFFCSILFRTFRTYLVVETCRMESDFPRTSLHFSVCAAVCFLYFASYYRVFLVHMTPRLDGLKLLPRSLIILLFRAVNESLEIIDSDVFYQRNAQRFNSLSLAMNFHWNLHVFVIFLLRCSIRSRDSHFTTQFTKCLIQYLEIRMCSSKKSRAIKSLDWTFQCLIIV